MVTTEERFETMQPAFDKAAHAIVTAVRHHGYSAIVLEPGDSTCYRFIFIGPGNWHVFREDDSDTVRPNKAWWVTLTMGHSYEWGGHSMSWDYCAEKWAEKSRPWTGRVVCALLNSIADITNKEDA